MSLQQRAESAFEWMQIVLFLLVGVAAVCCQGGLIIGSTLVFQVGVYAALAIIPAVVAVAAGFTVWAVAVAVWSALTGRATSR